MENTLNNDLDVKFEKNVLDEVRSPFTDEEKSVMDLLVKAHNKFVELEIGHEMDIQEWVASIHSLQAILSHRCLRREFPEYFR